MTELSYWNSSVNNAQLPTVRRVPCVTTDAQYNTSGNKNVYCLCMLKQKHAKQQTHLQTISDTHWMTQCSSESSRLSCWGSHRGAAKDSRLPGCASVSRSHHFKRQQGRHLQVNQSATHPRTPESQCLSVHMSGRHEKWIAVACAYNHSAAHGRRHNRFNLAHSVIFLGLEGGAGTSQLHPKLILFCISTLLKICDCQGEPHTNRANLYCSKCGISTPRACDWHFKQVITFKTWTDATNKPHTALSDHSKYF